MSNPGREHWADVKWIPKYLKGTIGVCLRYGVGKPMLKGFTDSDMSGDADSSRSTLGYVMTYAVTTSEISGLVAPVGEHAACPALVHIWNEAWNFGQWFALVTTDAWNGGQQALRIGVPGIGE